VCIHCHTTQTEDDLFVQLLTPQEQGSLALRQLLLAFCIERQLNPQLYCLVLKDCVLGAAATFETTAAAFDISCDAILMLLAVASPQPIDIQERIYLGEKMSLISVSDGKVVMGTLVDTFMPLFADNNLRAVLEKVTGIIIQAEKVWGLDNYRQMSDSRRFHFLINYIRIYLPTVPESTWDVLRQRTMSYAPENFPDVLPGDVPGDDNENEEATDDTMDDENSSSFDDDEVYSAQITSMPRVDQRNIATIMRKYAHLGKQFVLHVYLQEGSDLARTMQELLEQFPDEPLPPDQGTAEVVSTHSDDDGVYAAQIMSMSFIDQQNIYTIMQKYAHLGKRFVLHVYLQEGKDLTRTMQELSEQFPSAEPPCDQDETDCCGSNNTAAAAAVSVPLHTWTQAQRQAYVDMYRYNPLNIRNREMIIRQGYAPDAVEHAWMQSFGNWDEASLFLQHVYGGPSRGIMLHRA